MLWLTRRFLAVFFALFLGGGSLFAKSELELAQLELAELELVMFERAGCPWCVRWDREVAPIYPRTELGQRLPLRKINLDHDKSQSTRLDLPIRFTPTFVLIQQGREVGRIVGYMNDATFWGLLEQMVRKTAVPQNNSNAH